MRGPISLGAVRMVAGLQALRADAARRELRLADEALSDRSARTRDQRTRQAEALESWHNALADGRPDLGRIRRMGDWLVARQADLRSADLDQQIAQAQRDDRAVALAMTTALHDVALEQTARLRRQAAKAREGQRQQTADDLHRARRYSCRSR